MEKEVSRQEFDTLRKDVDELKEELNNSKEILQKIDKKLDVISEKMTSSEKIEELKYAPLEKRVDKIEDNSKWLWRTIAGALIGIVITAIFAIKNGVH